MSPLFCTADEAEARTKLYTNLLAQLGLTQIDELERMLAASGWDFDRLRTECEAPDARARLDAAINARTFAGVEKAASRQMTGILSTGPQALAAYNCDELAEFISDTALRRLAREYDPSEHGGRLVCGPTGIGKSVAGAAALRRCALREQRTNMLKPQGNRWDVGSGNSSRIAWVRALDLPNARLAHGLGSGEPPLVETAKRASFLVLDDLGWESKRASADDVITEVIATRYDMGRVTYATTGLSLTDFQDRYGSAIMRRLTEAGRTKGKVVNCWSK